jgi:UDP-glucose 4-epimerase
MESQRSFPPLKLQPFPIQTSLYGASKAACEALISAYSFGYGFQSYTFRFVSVLGERYSHGHVADFYRQLRLDPTRLRVLGDGTQTKSYMYIGDCVKGVLAGIEQGKDGVTRPLAELVR